MMPEQQLRGRSQNKYSSQGESIQTFRDLIKIILRRKNGIMIAIVLACIGALSYHFLQTPEYRAVSILMINGKQDQSDLFSKVLGPSGFPDNLSVKKDAELIQSMPIAEKTIHELDKTGKSEPLELFGARPYNSPLAIVLKPILPLFAAQHAGMSSDDRLKRTAIELTRRIRVEPVRETNVLKVSVASPYPEEAALLTNTLCRIYRDADIGMNSEKYAQANRFIAEMLEEQQKKVHEADSALSDYMAKHEIFEVTANTQQLLEKLVEADARYNGVVADQNIMKNNLDFLNSKLSENDKVLSLRISKNVSDQLKSILDEMQNCENDYFLLVKEKGVDASETRAKRLQLDVMRERYEQLNRSKIAGEIGYAGRTQKFGFDMLTEKLQIERKLNELSFSAREYSRMKSYYESLLSSLPKKEQDFVRLQRDREAVSKTYVFLKEKLDETRILLGSEVGSVSVVGAASLPLKPELPDIRQTLLMGLLLGGLFAGVYTYGAETMDNNVWDESFFINHRVGRVFMIPEVGRSARGENSGALIQMKPHQFNLGSKLKLVTDVSSSPVMKMTDNLMSSFAESIRILRVHLDYISADRCLQVILVSGTVISEGKSSICANLGMAYAMTGRKTLVVDCDFLHATQHDVFDCSREEGLSDYLLDRDRLFDSALFQPTHVENLWVLTAGRRVMNPSELLGSGKMSPLMTEIKNHFDVILLDSPPLYLSDSVQLSQMVDGILLVSRLGYTDKRVFQDLVADEFFSQKILGVAITGHSGSDQYNYMHATAVS